MADTESNASPPKAARETTMRASFGKSGFAMGLKRIASAFTLARDFKPSGTAEAALPKTPGTSVYDAYPKKPEGRKLDNSKELPSLPGEKPLPSVPYDKEALEAALKPFAEKILREQSISHANAREKLNIFQRFTPAKPSTDASESTKGLGEAKAVALKSAIQGKGRMIDIPAKAGKKRPSAEFRMIARANSISSIGSTQSGSSTSSVDTVDTSISTHGFPQTQQPQQTKSDMETRTRPPLHELYSSSLHLPARGR